MARKTDRTGRGLLGRGLLGSPQKSNHILFWAYVSQTAILIKGVFRFNE